MCRKQCDANHQDHEEINNRKHECKNGHQLLGFGGAKYENDQVILYSCDELKDHEFIKSNNQKIQWKNFKEKNYQNWSFDSSQQFIQENRKKNVIIWNLTGKQLCQSYNEQGKNLVHVDAQIQQKNLYKKTHYIIMLDGSGSMKYEKITKQEDPKNESTGFLGYFFKKKTPQVAEKIQEHAWDLLLKSFKQFLYKLQSNDILKKISKISVIVYDSESNICIDQEEPNINLVERIEYKGGCTNFDNPLIDAYELCNKNKNDYDNFVLYFMSDGVSEFPEQGISKLTQNQEILEKIKFYSVAFGNYSNNDILQQIAENFHHGSLKKAISAEELQDSLYSIIPNLY